MMRWCVALLLWSLASMATARDCVILLHGLARSAGSMAPMAEALEAAGYHTSNPGYPSRRHPIEELAPMALEAGLAGCPGDGPVHIVTHSLGGILVRAYLAEHALPRLGRVVMLAPPNQGSEVVDNWRRVPGFAALNGPAGLQLGTDAASVPRALGPVDFELGVIAGTASVNWLLSQSLPNPDDGKVSVASTRVEGMADHAVVRRTHPLIMRAAEVQAWTLHFLAHGAFPDDAQREPSVSKEAPAAPAD